MQAVVKGPELRIYPNTNSAYISGTALGMLGRPETVEFRSINESTLLMTTPGPIKVSYQGKFGTIYVGALQRRGLLPRSMDGRQVVLPLTQGSGHALYIHPKRADVADGQADAAPLDDVAAQEPTPIDAPTTCPEQAVVPLCADVEDARPLLLALARTWADLRDRQNLLADRARQDDLARQVAALAAVCREVADAMARIKRQQERYLMAVMALEEFVASDSDG